MRFERALTSAEGWNAALASSPRFSLMQSWEYAEAQIAGTAWSVERGFILNGGSPVGATQVLARRLPRGMRGGVAWVSRGPLWIAPGPPGRDSELMAALARHYAVDRGFYLRLAPAAPDDAVIAEPFRRTGVKGWASAILDIASPEDALRAGLRGNWRNVLNRAERAGLDVEIGSDAPLFEEFLARHATFMSDRRYETTVTPDFLRKLQTLLLPDRKMIVVCARLGGDYLGSALIARYGTTAEYLAGNSTDQGRKLGAGQLVLWRSILEMKRLGFARFDLGGLDPERTEPGIAYFKAGINGSPYRLSEEVEVIGGVTSRLLAAYVAFRRRT